MSDDTIYFVWREDSAGNHICESLSGRFIAIVWRGSGGTTYKARVWNFGEEIPMLNLSMMKTRCEQRYLAINAAVPA